MNVALFVPVAGDAAKALIKAGRKVANEVGEEAAEQAVKEGVQQVNERFVQEGVEHAVGTSTFSTKISTGARELNPYDFDGAEQAYDVIRGSRDDVASISKNTGINESRVARIKDHVFHRTHQLDDGVRRFDADPEIANAWRRLEAGTHTPKDLQLLEHELFESRFEGIFRTDYRTAHGAANRSGRLSGLE